MVFVHKEENKSLNKNYRPISFISVLSKIFERLIYKNLFNHFYCNILTKNQSGFMLRDSCIFQLLTLFIQSILLSTVILLYMSEGYF